MRCKKCRGRLKKFDEAKQFFRFLTVNVLICENGACGVLHDTAGNIHYRRVKGITGGYELSYGKNKIPSGRLCKNV